jgi:hypothetical protein
MQHSLISAFHCCSLSSLFCATALVDLSVIHFHSIYLGAVSSAFYSSTYFLFLTSQSSSRRAASMSSTPPDFDQALVDMTLNPSSTNNMSSLPPRPRLPRYVPSYVASRLDTDVTIATVAPSSTTKRSQMSRSKLVIKKFLLTSLSLWKSLSGLKELCWANSR